MNYFKDSTGNVYAYDDEQVAAGWVKEGLTPMTPEEVELHLNPVFAVPLPEIEPVELANPTVEEWNAVCDALGLQGMMR